MPNSAVIRERVIRLIREHAPVPRYTLEQMFATSTRRLAKQVISDLISENYIALTGLGRRGNPITIQISAAFPEYHCPLCGRAGYQPKSITLPEDR